jgi:hypothetical protein
MREIRQSGSEGGGAETNRLSLPLFHTVCVVGVIASEALSVIEFFTRLLKS